MQIFYIDADEEITSVIDRLKKSKAGENFFVVPKRALVLQSAVNLKLLQREAERLKKEIILVTHDQSGKVFARKAGISLGNLPEEVENGAAVESTVKTAEELVAEKISKKSRLEGIGSRDFFNAAGEEPRRSAKKSEKKTVRLKIKEEKTDPPAAEKHSDRAVNFSLSREEKLKKMFLADLDQERSRGDVRRAAPVSGKVKKIFIVLGTSCFLTATATAAYLFIPWAEVIAHPRYETKEVNVEIAGAEEGQNLDESLKAIPARIIEKEKEAVLSYPATGKNSAGGQKAHGQITIFNEYGASPQTLVATTRFLSGEGKLFRLVKTVIVPGASVKDGKMEAGKIEAGVTADEAGEEFNIEPSRFSIPGFSGGPKYEKFYAVSGNPMSGGGSNGEKTLNVSQSDIDEAKKKTEAEVKKMAEEELKNELAGSEIFLPESAEETILESESLAKVGDARESFECRAKVKLKTLVFSENDVKEITTAKLKEELASGMTVKSESVQLEYRYPEANFHAKTIQFKVQGKITAAREINAEELKKELLGKNEDQIKEILKKHPELEKIEINFHPSFLASRVPPSGKRVKIKLAEN